MKLILIVSFLASLIFEFNKVSQANELKNKAAQYYKKQEYLFAIRYYQELQSVYNIKEEALQLNLAHAYFKIAALSAASAAYKKLLFSKNDKIRSLVNHQLGVIAAYQGKEKLALSYLKNALIANHTNEQARYNYEVITKKIKSEEDTQRTSSSKSKAKKGEGSGNNKNQTSETNIPSDSPMEDPYKETSAQQIDTKHTNLNTTKENSLNDQDFNDVKMNDKGAESANALQTTKFNEIHMSESRARQLLENMKEQEFLILQLQKKTSNNKTKVDQDW